MEIMEIVLLIAGGIIFILSFFIPDKKESVSGMTKDMAEDEIKKLVSQELEAVRGHVDDVVEEAVSYAMEKTERSLERLSNEKIMAVSEYSDTVLAEIHKNHEEAMFLYDMLNNKHANLKDTVSEVNRTVKEAEETVNSFQRLVPETGIDAGGAEKSAKPAGRETVRAEAVRQDVSGQDASGQDAKKSVESWLSWENARRESPASAASGFVQKPDERGDNNNEKILELYKQGKTPVDIARELGLGVGEVRLVIDLFRNQ